MAEELNKRHFVMDISKRLPIFAVSIVVLIWMCILVPCCTWGRYVAKIEVVPGIEWFLIRPGHSRIVWEGKGVVAEGDLTLVFCDDGIELSCNEGNVVYLDIVKDVVLSDEGSFVPCRKSGYERGLTMFSAEGVMGHYGRVAAAAFAQERKALMNRVFSGCFDLGLMDSYAP